MIYTITDFAMYLKGTTMSIKSLLKMSSNPLVSMLLLLEEEQFLGSLSSKPALRSLP